VDEDGRLVDVRIVKDGATPKLPAGLHVGSISAMPMGRAACRVLKRMWLATRSETSQP
jgi:hypothetical protein